MAEITAFSLEQAKDVYQFYYGNDYVYMNALRRPNGNFLRALEQAATAPITVVQGRGLSFYVRENNRSGYGYVNDTTGDLSHLQASPESGSTINVAFDEVYVRTEVTGKELRSSYGQTASFVDLFQSINDDATTRYTEARSTQILNIGTGLITSVTTGTTGVNTGDTITLGVANVELLGEAIGLGVDIYASDTTTPVLLSCKILSVSTTYGTANITLIVNGTGYTSVTVSAGALLYIQKANGKTFLQGLKYCIDDGSNYATYPYQVSGGSQTGLDRSLARWQGLRAQLVTTSSQVQLSFDHLDALDDRMNTRAGIPILDSDGNFVATDLMYVCRSSHYRSLGDASRTIGRQYTLSEVRGPEDNGLRFQSYNNRGFLLNPFAQPDQVMLVHWPSVAVGWEQRLQPITQGEYGPLKQSDGNHDLWVASWAERMNMIVVAPRNCGRISGVIGRGDNS